MAWIKSPQELRNSPKVKRLARMLNESIPEVIGHLHLLWWWALDYAPSGDLSEYSEIELAEACKWSGNPFVFVDALVYQNFICQDLRAKKTYITDWQKYGGKLNEKIQKSIPYSSDSYP
jgi:hypothetical protein